MIFGFIILSISVPWLEYDTYMRKPKDKLGTGKNCKLSFVKNFNFSKGINLLLVLWRWLKNDLFTNKLWTERNPHVYPYNQELFHV